MNPFGDFLPGINVGAAIDQLLTGKDRDVLSGFTNSNRPGQVQQNWLPDPGVRPSGGSSGSKTVNNTGSYTAPASNPTTAPASTYAPNYAQQNAAALGQLGQSESVINNALNRLGVQLDIARGNIGSQYSQKNNELDTGFKTNENSYNTSTTQNNQNLRSNKNVINDQASSGLRGLQRLLGSWGAVGSDMGLAGDMVGNVATQQNAGAGQTFSQNQQALDTNWGNFKNQFDNEKKKLTDWKSQQEQQAEQQSLTSRQDLLSKLADIRGQMAAARGGNYAGAAQSYIDQANGLSGRIDELGRFNPTYTGSTPLYEAAPLSSYDTGRGATLGLQTPTSGGLNTPFLNALLGNRDKERQQLV